MGLSPGPASTVLRFLRGGCDGCLCGRLCEPCRDAGDSGYSEGVVARVTPERVILTDGRVFRRPGGGAPRPGQTVVIDPRPGIVWHGQGQVPRDEGRDETVLPPPTPSYDSPQRPGAWGVGFLPGVRGEPPQPPRAFAHEARGDAPPPPPLSPFFPTELLGASGASTPLPTSGPLRVRVGVGASTLRQSVTRLYPGWSYALDPYDPGGTGVYHPRGEVGETPAEWSPTGRAIPAISLTADQTLSRPVVEYREGGEWRLAGVRELEVGVSDTIYPEFDALAVEWHEASLVGPPPPDPANISPIVLERRGPLRTGLLYTAGRRNQYGWHRQIQLVPLAGRYWKLAHLGAEGNVPDAEGWYRGVLLQVQEGRDPFPWGQYPCRQLNTMPFTRLPDPPPPWRDRTWQTLDGSVRWTRVEGEAPTLTAWGQTLRGGTWAGLRGPPQLRADGTLDFGDVLILHEAGGAVTLLSRRGLESCPRATFEREVLRCPPGAFRGFSPVGLGTNVWPPGWAWAVTGEDEARALTAWDPWRDTTRREWPSRPRRRPPLGRALAPPPTLRPPLGLTLATTGRVPRSEEPLRRFADGRQQPPYHLPSRVEVWREGRWVNAPAARAALSRTMLYAPAGLADDLEDRGGVRGELRVTWGGEAMPRSEGALAALLLRARVGREPPAVTVNGWATEVRPLGRNAGERGWQPFLVTWGGGYLAAHASPLTLACSAPLSRLLLTRAAVGEATGGGDAT